MYLRILSRTGGHAAGTQLPGSSSVRQIAACGIMNKNRCTELFRKYTQLSPIKYLNEYRLYMAKSLILNTGKSVSEISADVGYNQISHFIEQFRLNYGMSPLKYRKKFASTHSLS